MRSGRKTRRADLGDRLATLHTLAAHDENLRAVRVAGLEAVPVIDGQHVAVTLDPSHLGDDAGGRRFDLHAHRRRHVDAFMWPRKVEDRMHALARERTRE